ncbi:LysR family transcriptional regulator [Mesorhizobium sp. M2D.F.Ca.ET.185.01.1.1]|uniref:LysR family transcriptional regulator n=1 Tax=unclassified Mesorhizobium TaxID=325217 RepID=UPI000FCA7D15|nr:MULTISPECIES: LysR family transcriptional regulator [unclassified Mesorhizobium]TGP55427.1 LysR family transcriptional regulator [bacterium M00.F.Ca.ET.230.01.1.1]TGP82572.1 LysR family transcriptional regulator [bacterium M00.F.Ca.ET.227.01.1.1]TGP94326.1 LysR family transcriptional regulator [bacterium M00.F.Ca.ET.221.01.1.1]TGP97780.1 LysR family transcriptional regulator [bacterium M00.F.Ca.ET.222.01.1.1]TGU11908.1 LysR family transcriptional regulator [bacterium M00.F.Ca.ET.163.01.1.1]
MTLQRRLLPNTAALAAFEAVARLGSFTAAARELDLTQGAVSRQINLLEEQFGRRLFERDSRNVRLSAAGEIYAEAVRSALGQLRDAALGLMSNRHGGVLNLAILPTFGTRWLMPLIPDFVARHPDITINFATRVGRFDFGRERLDAAIHHGMPDWPDAESTLLMRETVMPVVSPEFLATRDIATPADISRLPLLHMATRPGAWSEWFEEQGLEAPTGPGMQFEQFGTVAQACMAGLGVALLPEILIAGELQRGQLVPAPGKPMQSRSAYYLVVPHDKRGHPPVATFRDWLLGQIAREPAVLAW